MGVLKLTSSDSS